YYNGNLDEVAVYQTVLSDDQIANHYNIGVSGGRLVNHGRPIPLVTANTGFQMVTWTLPTSDQVGKDPLSVSTSGDPRGERSVQEMAIADQLVVSTPAADSRFLLSPVKQAGTRQPDQLGQDRLFTEEPLLV